MSNKTYVFDLDGVICSEEKTFERSFSKPNSDIISKINALSASGNTIIIFTSRSWAEYRVTKKWLEDNNVSYDELIMGKPIYDYWIDDRSLRPEEMG